MASQLHSAANDLRLILQAQVDSDDTEFTVGTGEGATCPDVPFWLVIDSEEVNVTDVTDDTLTVERGANSTTPAGHSSESKLDLMVIAGRDDEVNDTFGVVFRFLARAWGGGDGVIRDAQAATFFEVVAQDTPDMTVKVKDGMAIVSSRPVEVTSDTTTDAISAPTVNPRIDVVQVSHYDVVTIVTGEEAGSPSAPSVDSNCLKLAEIYCRVGMTVIKDADDASNGYITDARVFV